MIYVNKQKRIKSIEEPPSNAHILSGTSSETQLPDNTANAITVGYAAHWLLRDKKATLAEFLRIGNSDTKLGLLYGNRLAGINDSQSLAKQLRDELVQHVDQKQIRAVKNVFRVNLTRLNEKFIAAHNHTFLGVHTVTHDLNLIELKKLLRSASFYNDTLDNTVREFHERHADKDGKLELSISSGGDVGHIRELDL